MALVALSPIRKAHCTTSGETPILSNIGMKMNAINVHLEVADTMMRLISALNMIKRIRVDKLPNSIEESRFAPIIARHLSRCEYSKQANICAAKKAITKYTPSNFIGCAKPSITSASVRYRPELNP